MHLYFFVQEKARLLGLLCTIGWKTFWMTIHTLRVLRYTLYLLALEFKKSSWINLIFFLVWTWILWPDLPAKFQKFILLNFSKTKWRPIGDSARTYLQPHYSNGGFGNVVTDWTFGLAELFGRTFTVRFGPNDRTFFCRTQNLFFHVKN